MTVLYYLSLHFFKSQSFCDSIHTTIDTIAHMTSHCHNSMSVYRKLSTHTSDPLRTGLYRFLLKNSLNLLYKNHMLSNYNSLNVEINIFLTFLIKMEMIYRAVSTRPVVNRFAMCI